MTDTNRSDDRLVLHGSFTSSSSYKPMLFLVLSGLPFSFRTVNLKKGAQKEAPHLAINRYGQVPVLQHRGLTLVMSNVILDYLARTTGKFEADNEQDRLHCREWLSWENDAITNVARVRHFARFRPDVPQQIVDYFRPGAEAALDFIDKALEGRQWLVGNHCTIADLGCFGRMVFMAEGGMNLDKRPRAAAWRERIMAMPGFAPPYDLIPKKDTEFERAHSA
jgi:glutathione S-transferase